MDAMDKDTVIQELRAMYCLLKGDKELDNKLKEMIITDYSPKDVIGQAVILLRNKQ